MQSLNLPKFKDLSPLQQSELYDHAEKILEVAPGFNADHPFYVGITECVRITAPHYYLKAKENRLMDKRGHAFKILSRLGGILVPEAAVISDDDGIRRGGVLVTADGRLASSKWFIDASVAARLPDGEVAVQRQFLKPVLSQLCKPNIGLVETDYKWKSIVKASIGAPLDATM